MFVCMCVFFHLSFWRHSNVLGGSVNLQFPRRQSNYIRWANIFGVISAQSIDWIPHSRSFTLGFWMKIWHRAPFSPLTITDPILRCTFFIFWHWLMHSVWFFALILPGNWPRSALQLYQRLGIVNMIFQRILFCVDVSGTHLQWTKKKKWEWEEMKMSFVIFISSAKIFEEIGSKSFCHRCKVNIW